MVFFTTAVNSIFSKRYLNGFMPSVHRSRQVLAMDSLARLLVYELEKQPFYATKIRQIAAIELPGNLDFIGESSSWSFLSKELGAIAADGASLILHPELYLLQSSVSQVYEPCTNFLDNDEIVQQSVSLTNSQVIYSCHKLVPTYFSQCRLVVPWAELVRVVAEKKELPCPWIIVNSQYLWATDVHGRLYETRLTNSSYLSWLMSQLLPEHMDCRKYIVMFDSEETAKLEQLSKLNPQKALINPEFSSVESMLRLIVQEL